MSVFLVFLTLLLLVNDTASRIVNSLLLLGSLRAFVGFKVGVLLLDTDFVFNLNPVLSGLLVLSFSELALKILSETSR